MGAVGAKAWMSYLMNPRIAAQILNAQIIGERMRQKEYFSPGFLKTEGESD